MTIFYFGEIADVTNKPSEEITAKNVQEIVQFLQQTYQLEMADFHIAINHNLVDKTENTILKSTDEVAVLSAFAGG